VKNLVISSACGMALPLAASFVLFCTIACAQETTGPSSSEDAVRTLQEQVRELRSLVEEMRAENTQSRVEMRQLRQDLQTTRAMLDGAGNLGEKSVAANSASHESQANEPVATTGTQPQGNNLEQRVEKLEESTSLMGSKINEQYQTKVESASKYRARLHGIVLMNAFRNVGNSDSLDLPDYAEPLAAGSPAASIGATLRQSELGLEIFGPTVFGAKTSADVQLDFAGGFPGTGNGVNFGVARLQTANVRFDWQHTSVVAGQDSLFISPLSPTSFQSLATPAFAFAGNLWGWTPQLRVEHRFAITDEQSLSIQAGVLDNLDWEFPQDPFYRYPQAGEASGQPAYAVRTSWTRQLHAHPLSFGAAGYYGRQNWTWDRYVDSWAGIADWQIPIAPRLALSGEFYRGRGIGGLGGGIGRSVVYGGNFMDPTSPIRAVDSAGGWTQLKLQITPKLELNGVFAQDDAFTANIRNFASDSNNLPEIVGRNRGALANIVFRPRSDLILSAELRRLRTFPVYSNSAVMNQAGISVGILF
jgi:hypothetical protein